MTAPTTPSVTQADMTLVEKIAQAIADREFYRADKIAARHRQAAEAEAKAREAELAETLRELVQALDDSSTYGAVATIGLLTPSVAKARAILARANTSEGKGA